MTGQSLAMFECIPDAIFKSELDCYFDYDPIGTVSFEDDHFFGEEVESKIAKDPAPAAATIVNFFLPITPPQEKLGNLKVEEKNACREAIRMEPKVGPRKLIGSRSPILDAFLSCALDNFGASLFKQNATVIRISNLEVVFECIEQRAVKANMSKCSRARKKTLAAWYMNFPRGVCSQPFLVTAPVDRESKIIERLRAVLSWHRDGVDYQGF
jgi:hypothetical protein